MNDRSLHLSGKVGPHPFQLSLLEDLTTGVWVRLSSIGACIQPSFSQVMLLLHSRHGINWRGTVPKLSMKAFPLLVFKQVLVMYEIHIRYNLPVGKASIFHVY